MNRSYDCTTAARNASKEAATPARGASQGSATGNAHSGGTETAARARPWSGPCRRAGCLPAGVLLVFCQFVAAGHPAAQALDGPFDEQASQHVAPDPAPAPTAKSQESGRPAVAGFGKVGRPAPNSETALLRGTVRAEGSPLAGVLVSDGFRVARTDAQGCYELPLSANRGRFVFVSTPAGYWTDQFYLRTEQATAAGRADFTLRRVEQSDRFDFVFITDMHLENKKVGLAKFQASLREINQLQPRPAFLWSQGDISLQGHSGPDYAEALKLVDMPVRNGPGNHEMMLAKENPREDFEQLFGPTYYSFDWGPIHCIVLDGNKPISGVKDYKGVHGAVEGSELAWLRADLAAQPPGKPIVVGIHIPIVTTYPERRRENPPDAPYWEVTNRDVLADLFAAHQVRLVLQGHMHENERMMVKGVEYVESISISGCWWQSGSGLERGVDGSPRGYRIVSVDGTKVTHRYQPSCESRVDRQGEFYGLDKPVARGAAVPLVFNCYDAPHGATAEARLDDGAWQPMPALAAMNHEIGLAMTHHFRLLADTTTLAPGRHTITARVRWPGGETVEEQTAFTLAGD